MNWRRLHLIEDVLLPLLLIVLRLCWLWPWLELLRRWLAPSYTGPLVPLWVMGALMVGGLVAARTLSARGGNLGRARLQVAALGLAILALLLWWQYAWPTYALWDLRWGLATAQTLTHWGAEVPAVLLTALCAAVLWLRGMWDGQRTLLHDDVWSAFVFGCGAFVVLLLLAQLDPAGLPPGTDRWMLVFVGVGMSALAFASLQLAQVTGRSEAEVRPALSRYWLVSVFSVIGALLGLGLAVSLVVAPATVAQLFGWTRVVVDLLLAVLGFVLLIIAYVVFWVLTPVIDWLRALVARTDFRVPPPANENFQRQWDELLRQTSAQIPPAAVETARWIVFAVCLAVIALVFALALRYFRRANDEAVEENV